MEPNPHDNQSIKSLVAHKHMRNFFLKSLFRYSNYLSQHRQDGKESAYQKTSEFEEICADTGDVDLTGDSWCASYGDTLSVELNTYEYVPKWDGRI